MDLVAGAKKIILASTHQAKDGSPKLVKKLTYPTSGGKKANMLVTEHAVFTFSNKGVELVEILSDISLEELQKITGANFTISQELIRN